MASPLACPSAARYVARVAWSQDSAGMSPSAGKREVNGTLARAKEMRGHGHATLGRVEYRSPQELALRDYLSCRVNTKFSYRRCPL